MTEEQNIRYSRQTAVEEIGEDGQEKLLAAKVAIVGCGALGSMVAMQLAGAGVGHLVIADFDTIDVSNLQRQFFFTTEEAGEMKSEVLADRITSLNPDCRVLVVSEMIGRERARGLFADCDFVVDATDNPASKHMIEEISGDCGKGCCVAGVSGFHGQVMTVAPGGTKFSELFSEGGEGGMLPCSTGGVLGPVAAMCASLQAAETIKWLTGTGRTLSGRLLTFDLLADGFSVFELG